MSLLDILTRKPRIVDKHPSDSFRVSKKALEKSRGKGMYFIREEPKSIDGRRYVLTPIRPGKPQKGFRGTLSEAVQHFGKHYLNQKYKTVEGGLLRRRYKVGNKFLSGKEFSPKYGENLRTFIHRTEQKVIQQMEQEQMSSRKTSGEPIYADIQAVQRTSSKASEISEEPSSVIYSELRGKSPSPSPVPDDIIYEDIDDIRSIMRGEKSHPPVSPYAPPLVPPSEYRKQISLRLIPPAGKKVSDDIISGKAADKEKEYGGVGIPRRHGAVRGRPAFHRDVSSKLGKNPTTASYEAATTTGRRRRPANG